MVTLSIALVRVGNLDPRPTPMRPCQPINGCKNRKIEKCENANERLFIISVKGKIEAFDDGETSCQLRPLAL